ncbi:hypothetical protein FSP39_017900 [Pinctada imbricata]|uniref:CSD domain-containing protein n=1 Tax=Pinctada imbricata TaxID=66713 RepID=A0AA88XT20_PINIB|nr:hypothetical protein FSP39_017900 [Pinctada imbricata]
MSSPRDIPQTQALNNEKLAGSPGGHHTFLVPSPIPTRRTRTTHSESERARDGPELKGVVKDFCRQKGHGFIIPDDKSAPLFVHISDVDGEYVPKPGDEVSYKKFLIPPKMEKYQAVHVVITHLNPGVSHETWNSPVPHPDTTQNQQ